MNKIWIISRKDISEAFRSRSTYIILIVMIFLTISYISVYTGTVNSSSYKNNMPAIDSYSRAYLSTLAYILPLMFSNFICSIFANYAVIVDKAKRNIESLMATPVSIKQIWMGKSLAVTLPSIGIGIGMAIISYLVLAIGFVMPHTHSFIFPGIVSIISALIIVPALLFVIVAIVTYIQLTITNPRIGNFVFSGVFIILLIGGEALLGMGLSTNYLALIYLAMILVCTGFVYILSFSLTKERVLLSSKV
jgi:ABC-2 type transport system permease protein